MTKTITIGKLTTDLETFISYVSVTGGMRACKSTLRRQLLELLVAREIEKYSKHDLVEQGMSLNEFLPKKPDSQDFNLSTREINKETEKQALFHKGVKRGKYLSSNNARKIK